MKKDLLYLAERLEQKSKEIEERASLLAIRVTLDIVEDLAYETPVDTSKAISNWVVSLNTPSNQELSPHLEGSRGSTYLQSAEETIRRAKEVLKAKSPGQKIYITNNAPYIKKLNDGWSSQALSGFVERAVIIGRDSVKTAKFKN